MNIMEKYCGKCLIGLRVESNNKSMKIKGHSGHFHVDTFKCPMCDCLIITNSGQECFTQHELEIIDYEVK